MRVIVLVQLGLGPLDGSVEPAPFDRIALVNRHAGVNANIQASSLSTARSRELKCPNRRHILACDLRYEAADLPKSRSTGTSALPR